MQVVAFVKGTRTEPQCGFSHRVLTLLNEARIDYEVGRRMHTGVGNSLRLSCQAAARPAWLHTSR